MGWFVGAELCSARETLRCHKAFREEQSSSPTIRSIGCILLNLEIAFALVGNSFRHGFAVPPPSVREAFASMKAFCFFAILCSFQAGGEEERSVITSFTEMCKDMVYSF